MLISAQSTIGDPRKRSVDKSRGTLGVDAGLMLPTSTGQLRLRFCDLKTDPSCDLRYLSSAQDRKAMRSALRLTAALAKQLQEDGSGISSQLEGRPGAGQHVDK